MKVKIGKNPHRSSTLKARLLRTSILDRIETLIQFTAVLEYPDCRHVWITFERGDNDEAIDQLIEGLRRLRGRTDVTDRTAIIAAVCETLGQPNDGVGSIAGRIADLSVKLMRGESA